MLKAWVGACELPFPGDSNAALWGSHFENHWLRGRTCLRLPADPLCNANKKEKAREKRGIGLLWALHVSWLCTVLMDPRVEKPLLPTSFVAQMVKSVG